MALTVYHRSVALSNPEGMVHAGLGNMLTPHMVALVKGSLYQAPGSFAHHGACS